MGKIVVVAGDHKQFRYWRDVNIIPVVSQQDVDRLQGTKIDKFYFEGTYRRWLDDRASDLLKLLFKGQNRE